VNDGGDRAADQILRFGPFELNVAARCLRNGDQVVRVPPRIYRLLEYLITHAGVAVTRDDLIDELWPGVAVSDHSLTEAVWRLRRLLDDNSKTPRFIQTIPGYGFRFIADVEHGTPTSKELATWPPLWKLALPGAALSGLMLAIALGTILIWAVPAPLERVVLAEITLPDGAPLMDYAAELSPDGLSMAFVQSNPPRLLVMDLVSAQTTLLGELTRIWTYRQLRWSPDGKMVALSDLPTDDGPGQIELFDVAAAQSEVILEWTAGALSILGWDSDSQRLLTSAEGPDEQRLLVLSRSGQIEGNWAASPLTEGRVSPDGRWLAASLRPARGEIVIVPIESIWSSELETGPDDFRDWGIGARITSPAPADDSAYWNPTSDRLLFFAPQGGQRNLWTVDLADGVPIAQPRLLQVPGDPYQVQGWASDGRIFFCSFDIRRDVVLAALDRLEPAIVGSPVVLSLREGKARVGMWSADPTTVLYKSYHEDAVDGDLYLAALGDGIESQTAFESTRHEVDGPFLWPAWSADGTRVYYSRREPKGSLGLRPMGLYAYELASGSSERLLPAELLVGPVAPSLDRSGRLLLFTNFAARQAALAAEATLAPGLYLLDLQSGALRLIDDHARDLATLAPDGASVALTNPDASELQLLSVDGRERRVLAQAPPGGWSFRSPFAFSPDGQELAYVLERSLPESLCGDYQLWLVDLRGGAPRHVQMADELAPLGAAWSPDGSLLAISTYGCQGSVMRYLPPS